MYPSLKKVSGENTDLIHMGIIKICDKTVGLLFTPSLNQFQDEQ